MIWPTEEEICEFWDLKLEVVSICCLTYNHEQFLMECLNGFVTQKSKYPFEILIHDDASIDSTQEMILDFQSKYPRIVKPLLQTENQRSKLGGGMNPRFNYVRSSGAYIAVCEGDDFWTDPFKIEKQVEFLKNNSDYSGCFCEANIVNELSSVVKEKAVNFKRDLVQKDIFKYGGWYVNAGLLFRNNLNFDDPHIKGINGGDRFQATLLTDNNMKIGYLEDVMCAYRVHQGGIYSLNSEYIKYKKIYQDFKKYKKSKYYKKYRAEINSKISSSLYEMGKNHIETKQWKEYFSNLFEIITLISFRSKMLNFKMFISSFITPIFKSKRK